MPVAFLLFLVLQTSELNRLIDGVDRSFAQMRDFSADFTQIFQDPLNRRVQESGHLYLMKQGKMRWEYKNPEEKLYVSDGKTVYFYLPADRQVSKEAVSKAIDDRIPLMFLLGRSNLRNEFTSFTLANDKPFLPGDKVIHMSPRRNTDFNEITIEVDPLGFAIRRLLFVHTGGERQEFIFSNAQTNTGLKASLFTFTPPPGVEVLNGIGR